MISLSLDGYLRMPYASFADFSFQHLTSGLDEDQSWRQQPLTNACTISGYTEWVSTASPVITIGWDWRLDVSRGRPRYLLAGTPRSNLMFIDEAHRDIGRFRTAVLLIRGVNAISWEPETANAIRNRYDSTT